MLPKLKLPQEMYDGICRQIKSNGKYIFISRAEADIFCEQYVENNPDEKPVIFYELGAYVVKIPITS